MSPKFLSAIAASALVAGCAPSEEAALEGGAEPSAQVEVVQGALATVNAIDFMRNTSATKKLLLDSSQSVGACTPEVSYHERFGQRQGDITHNFFYYVKSPDGNLYEQYNYDGSRIWLERDTSWPATDSGGQGAGYDAKPFGSLVWAANNWTEGANLNFSTRIVGFYWNSSYGTACRYDAHGKNYPVWGHKRFTYVPAKFWGGIVGSADSIAVDYYNPVWNPATNATELRKTETHWYARGRGWVSWEHFDGLSGARQEKCVWNRDGGATPSPLPTKCGNMGDRTGSFLGTSTQYTTQYGDWDSCYYKTTCAPGQGVQGISRGPSGATSQQKAVCAQAFNGGTSIYTGTHRATLRAPGEQRRAWRWVGGSNDWDTGYWKMECGSDEYVAAVSQGAASCGTGEGNFHGIVCAAGASASLQPHSCNKRILNGSDNRGTQSSGDWDPGAPKAECATNEYLAGVSVNPANYRIHALLCCTRW